jgi:hypothetical protein
VAGARVQVRARRADERAARADHVVVDDHLAAAHVGRERGDLGVGPAGAPLEHEARLHAQVVGQRLHPLGAPCVGGAQHEVLAAQLAQQRDDHGLGVHVQRADAAREVVRDALGVQVQHDHAVAAAGRGDAGEQARARLGHHHLTGLHGPLHGLVAEVRDQQRERVHAAVHQRAAEVVQLERVGVGHGAAQHHRVASAALFEDAQVALAVREPLAQERAARDLLVGDQPLGQGLIGFGTEQEHGTAGEQGTHHIASFTGRRAAISSARERAT